MGLIKVDWDNFQFRCHYFGELMVPAKGKSNLEKYNEALDLYEKTYSELEAMVDSPARDRKLQRLLDLDKKQKELEKIKDVPHLSETCKKRLAQIYTEETTGRKKDIHSLYIEKGLRTEEQSITLYSMYTGTMYRKNKQKISNGLVIGEIDFDDEENDIIVDTKSSFDIFTFDATVAVDMKKLYWWQLQCYMWIKHRSRGRLAYCLNNTPKDIVARLEKSLQYNFLGSQEEFEEACEQIRKNHFFEDLPLERKIRIYDTERDDDAIALAESKIPYLRNYLKTLDKNKLESYEYDN